MRIIKFRGKDATGQKGWVYGDLVHNMKVTATGLEPRVMVGGYEVVPSTVGEFTSLRDKNGEEIYEGDIIYSEFPDGSKTNCLIDWDEENSCFGLMDEYNYRSKLEGYDFPMFENAIFWHFRKHSKKFEVIGNIHDNPKLLSKSKHA